MMAIQKVPVALWGWARVRLFNTPLNAAITVLLVWGLWHVATGLWRWLFVNATTGPATIQDCVRNGGMCWSFLEDRYRIILFGAFPYDEQWRAATAIVLFFALVVLSCIPGLWTTPSRQRGMIAVWVTSLLTIAILLRGGLAGLPLVEPRLWAGLLLTTILASVGVVFAFAFAVLLALGRRSSMPVIRWASTAYIEVMRGVPLISLLLMVHILFPLLVPPDFNVDKLLRAQIAFILFFAAYMAETIRGGLQAVPPGQFAAADAIGLTYWQAHRRIILPQALRLVIPSLVNIFIAAFKDTSLVIVIGMSDLLGTANAAKADPKWWGIYIEAYLFIAAIYLVVCATMSHFSQNLERRLATAPAGR
jgi:general L-amino acid transport system permease protein